MPRWGTVGRHEPFLLCFVNMVSHETWQIQVYENGVDVCADTARTQDQAVKRLVRFLEEEWPERQASKKSNA